MDLIRASRLGRTFARLAVFYFLDWNPETARQVAPPLEAHLLLQLHELEPRRRPRRSRKQGRTHGRA